MVVVDTLRADHLGCYGYHRPTSTHIDHLANQGVLFERCYSTSSWTLPACTSLLSGLYSFGHGVDTWTSSVDSSLPWLPALLQEAGYHTMGVSSNPFLSRSHSFGRGFDIFDDETVLAAAEWSFPLLDSQYKAIVLASTSATATRRAMEMLNERPTDRPFFLLLHYMDCHADYVPPSPWNAAFDPGYDGDITGHAQSRRFATDLPERDLEQVIALYDGEVAHTDAHLGQLLEHLDALDLRENTCIIVTADHGEEFLEHGQWFHGHTLFEECVRVPLIISWPGVTPAGHRVSEPVSLVDVMPTLLSRLGLDAPSAHGMDLGPALIGGEAPTDRPLFMETRLSRPLLGMVRGSTKIVAEVRESGERAVLTPLMRFDLASDPKETVQDASVAPDRRQALAERLQEVMSELAGPSSASDLSIPSSTVDLQAEQLERLRSLGYIGGE